MSPPFQISGNCPPSAEIDATGRESPNVSDFVSNFQIWDRDLAGQLKRINMPLALLVFQLRLLYDIAVYSHRDWLQAGSPSLRSVTLNLANKFSQCTFNVAEHYDLFSDLIILRQA